MRHLRVIAAASTCLGIVPGGACASSCTQPCAPFYGSLILSALFAALRPAVLFVLVGGLHVFAKWASAAVLAIATLAASLVRGVSTGQIASGALERVAFDQHAQAVLAAFYFGALLESFAGGGSPVAVCAAALIVFGLGLLHAAACPISDTSLVAFGSLGQPTTMPSKVSGLHAPALSATVGWQASMIALLVPSTRQDPVGLVDPLSEVARVFTPNGVTLLVAAAVQIMVGPVHNAAGFGNDPHAQARGVPAETETAELGSPLMHAVGSRPFRTFGELCRFAPDLGRHDGEVLASLPTDDVRTCFQDLWMATSSPTLAGPCSVGDQYEQR